MDNKPATICVYDELLITKTEPCIYKKSCFNKTENFGPSHVFSQNATDFVL